MDPVVNILLVDDDPRNLGVLETVLSSSDYRLIRAQSAAEALLALLRDDFAAIVLDIQMPDMTGIELANLIKQRKRTQHVPIIFLTAHFLEDKDILQGYVAGAVDYLTKPINPKILRSKIGVFVDLFRKTRALVSLNSALEVQVAQRQEAEEALRKVNAELEARVQERTADLTRANNEMRANEHALRASEARLSAVFEQAGAGIAQKDLTGRFLMVNERYCEIVGRDRDALLQLRMQDITYPEDLPTNLALFEASVREGKLYVSEKRYVRPDGTLVWASTSVAPIRNAQGRVESVLTVTQDVTERKRGRDALASHASRAGLLSESAAVLLMAESPRASLGGIFERMAREMGAEIYFNYLLTPDGKSLVLESSVGLTEPQRAALAALEASEWLCDLSTQPAEPLANTEPQSQQGAASLLRSLGIRAYLGQSLRAGERLLGMVAFASTSRAQFEAAELRFIHTMCDLVAASMERSRLLSEVRAARDAAEKASRTKDHFLATLSHELRTPLNPVLLLASESAQDPDLPAEVRADFAMVRAQIELEARLIDDLLDLTRITRGKLSLEMRVLDAHAVLRDVLATMRPEIEQKGLVLTHQFAAGQFEVLGDAVRLQQVFWNVLRNAIKFTVAPGTIAVHTKAERGQLRVEIIDSGVGMNPEEVERAFDAFWQANPDSDRGPRGVGGVGLGLAISRTLIGLHLGSIQGYSEGRNRGSTFVIEIPLRVPDGVLRDQAHPSLTPSTSPGIAEPPIHPQRVLLVEDHEPTRVALGRLLARRRFEVVDAASVADALAVAEKSQIDILISDIGLPDGSGYDLMAQLRERYNLKGIALTGYGMEHDIARSEAAGFSAHLTKPVAAQTLDTALATVTSERPQT